MSTSTSQNLALNSWTSLRTLSNQQLSMIRAQTRAERLRQEANRLSSDLREFVHSAWPILEPVTKLGWNWHLDLICEYLTLIKDNRFKEVCGAAMEGIIFNVPP